MYYFDSRVRFSEVDEDGCLSVQSLIDYFQDCSTFQSEDIGFGIAYLRESNQVWVITCWQIDIVRMPKLCEKIRVCTIPYGFKGFLGMRNFWLENEQGEKLAWANSLWSLLDTRTGHPLRISDEMAKAYAPEEKIKMEYLPRKIQTPREYETGEPIVIHKQHLDTNHHVNNGQYIRMAMDSLGKENCVRRIRVEYRKQVYLGDTLHPCVSWRENTCVVALRDKEDTVCCVAEFLTGGNYD